MKTAESIRDLVEYQCLAEIMDRIESCHPTGGPGYCLAVNRCLYDLACGQLTRAQAAEILEEARQCLLASAAGGVLRLRMEYLVDAIGTVLLDQLLDEAADLGRSRMVP